MPKKTRGQLWEAKVLRQYDVEKNDAAFASIELAARALDRADQAQARLDADGLTIRGLHGPRVHPCVSVLRDAVAEHARLCRLIGLFNTAEEA